MKDSEFLLKNMLYDRQETFFAIKKCEKHSYFLQYVGTIKHFSCYINAKNPHKTF